MSALFSPIRNLFRFHKLKVLGILAFALVFTLLFFPYDDLSDLVTAKVSQITNNTVYLQFDSLGLGFAPPSVAMDEVVVETQTLPSIKAGHLSATPLLMGLLTGKPGGSVDAENLFGGVVAADYREGDKPAKGSEATKIVGIDAKGLKLPELSKFLRDANVAPLSLQGVLDLSTNVTVDPLFNTQPNGDVEMKITNLVFPTQSLPVMGMKVAIPELKLGVTKLTAKMENGSLNISDFSFGNDKTVSGKVSGQLKVAFQRSNAGVTPMIGVYDLKVSLKMPPDFAQANQQGLNFAYGMMPGVRPQLGPDGGVQLAFRMQTGPNPQMPQFSAQ